MPDYRDNSIAGKTARAGAALGAAAGAFDAIFDGTSFLAGMVGVVGFGILGAFAGYIVGGVADLLGYRDNNPKKSDSSDEIYRKLTAQGM